MANYVILGKTYNNVEGIKATDDNGNEVVYETSENSTLSQLINNTLTSYSSTNATSLRDTLFAGKTALTTVNTPNVTSVGNSCFNGCSNLSSLTTGALTSIGSSSFVECSQLTSVNLASSLTMIPGYAFRNTGITSIPNQSTLTQIGDSSFSGCNGLTQITLSSTLTRVGNYAFQDCSNLSKVYFNCTSITGFSEYNCFRGCSSLLKVDTVDGANTLVVPTSMTQIPGWFIRGNNTITTVDVSNTQATSIGESAFNDIIAT